MPPKIRNFTRVGDALDPPGLNDLQLRSYEEFLQMDTPPEEREARGLEALLREVFPVSGPSGRVKVEYVSYELELPAHTERECRRLGLTYGHPLRVRLRVVGAETVEGDVYLGDIPRMIGGGEFIINGAERVVISQIQRSAGIDFGIGEDPSGRTVYSCRLVPERGTWIEFSLRAHDCLQARVGQSGKLPASWLIRALMPEASSDGELLGLFYGKEAVKLDPARPELAQGRRLAGEIVNGESGEVMAEAGAELTPELVALLADGGLEEVEALKDVREHTILRTLQKDPTHSHEEAVLKIYARFRPGDPPSYEKAVAFLQERLQDPRRYSLGEVGRFRINRKLGLDVPADRDVLCKEDLVESLRYLLRLAQGEGRPDDIDHLGNRLLRPVGRLAEEHLRSGFLRLGQGIATALAALKEDAELPPPQRLCGPKPIMDALRAFFGSGELSQVVDQTNPLSQLAHERRVSALGPGGLSRKRAGYEVRDVHPSHYGRLCPIETPEGPNIGLISYLSLYAGIDKYGFLSTPYRQVNGGAEGGEIRHLRADEEEALRIAPMGTANGHASPEGGVGLVPMRHVGELIEGQPQSVDMEDVSPRQLIGLSGSLIPFLEHDDANRALMGSNMQRQAVPLVAPRPPLVCTGMEGAAARSSALVVRARCGGEVEKADAKRIVVDGEEHPLAKFDRLNEGSCLNQRPIVQPGHRVEKGDVIADGPATFEGELALGRDVLVAFMPFDGSNFEDAVVFSDRLVRDDVFTSIHIEEFEADARETRDGREEFTRDIPHVSEDALRHLDEGGIVCPGVHVREGDILVGKVRPRPQSDPTAEEMLVRTIFGRSAEDVKNESVFAPPGCEGVVIGVERFARKVYLNDEERRQAKEDRRLAEEAFKRKAAEAFRRLAAALGRLESGAALGLPGESASHTEMRRAQEGFVLREDLLAPGDRDAARAARRAYERRIQEHRAVRDRLFRRIRTGDDLPPGVLEMTKVYVATKRKIQVGDKIAGRHGNKGVIARIVPAEDMPFLPDGSPVDVILNPLGVPSRMNVGQLLEAHLGWAAQALGFRAVTPVFDGADEKAIVECLREAGLPESGKSILFDGRTGERFDQEVTVGFLYMLKLHHLVEEKSHARSTGPYSLITQQPLGGKSRRGGQRVGEMEVWALEAYGAASILQEMMTVKSDDVAGRAAMYEKIVKGRPTLEASLPVSFDVLTNEIRGLCVKLTLTANGQATVQPGGAESQDAPGRHDPEGWRMDKQRDGDAE